jgi:holo-[acyl-carrier protein] synthase
VTNVLRSGVDLVDVQRMTGLSPAIRERFLRRVYTPRERQICQDADGQPSYESLAGRFAAKEAVAKALGVGIGPVAWQEIEILAAPSGEPLLQLHGAALAAAQQQGLQTWSVSISHTRTQAVAMAVAMGSLAHAEEHEHSGGQ